MLHYKAAAHTRLQKGGDLALMFFGMVAAVYTSVQTIKLMMQPSGAPDIGECTPPAPGAGDGPGSPFWLQILMKL
ncbi:neutral amino acid transporter [Ceratobasidium sp. 392]|nr:neutral amino acid transporter [Ceratobasidium sp. 392]